MSDALPAPPGSILAYAWLIPLVPALSAALILIAGRRIGRASAGIAIAAIGCSAVLSTLVFTFLLGQPDDARVYVVEIAAWLEVGPLTVNWALLLDPLAVVMLLLVTWVGLAIHVYSLGYMANDPRYTRFFGYLNLFAASMLILVTGASFLTLFVGWELVGLCSYLLVGFWFENRSYASAAKKAFVVNRVGDVGFMIAMFVIFAAFGSLDFVDVLPTADAVLGAGTAATIALLLFVGATGKSAQIPLFVWLPDAMAGPTPVSALIHAATMVTAGVYLVARSSPIFTVVPDVGLAVAWVGVATALVAALIACAQCDLKKILAYSTISQLGYMFVGVGVGDYTAGVFHLLTHGFFKALLFLAAGAVMHALAEETDVRRMGGLAGALPVTALTSLVAVVAISGLWPLSGYFSKEEILAAAAGTPGGQGIWFVGLVVAGLTAFYMARWFVLIFLGKPRWKAVQPALHPHEAPLSMTLPLVVLAVASAVGGLINVTPDSGFLHGWLAPSVVAFEAQAEFLSHAALVALALAVAAVGLVGGFLVYRDADPGRIGTRGGLVGVARARFGVDELYERTVAAPGVLLARGSEVFDRRGIDGAVNGLGRMTSGLAAVGRRTQTGFVRSYALATLLGAVLLSGVFLYRLVL